MRSVTGCPAKAVAPMMGAVVTDLFASAKNKRLTAAEPLAARMRPRNIDEFAGQSRILGPGRLLRRMIEADQLVSVIFYGPPGTGKTTLAKLIADLTRRRFVELNATTAGVKEVRDLLAAARTDLENTGQRTVLFLDEIHRFNRAQQDILLPDVERGVVTLIGATTGNPFFSINAPLVSRSQIFQFEPLTPEEIASVIRRAVQDMDRGFGRLNLHIHPAALDFLSVHSEGDARRALMALELAVKSQQAQRPASPADQTNAKPEVNSTPPVEITLEIARECVQAKALVYDPTGDDHYDSASALIKSMRGSDPDAAIYWLARMLAAGEDPRFIARRIAICASEDIGNADPMATVLAAAAIQITEFVGMPECRLTLAQAVTYLATCPKSNAATVAIDSATRDVKEQRAVPVPRHLRDTHYAGAQRLGHKGYQYAHDSKDGYVSQDYLGVDRSYYLPVNRGHEAVIRGYLEKLRAIDQARGTPSHPEEEGPEDEAET